MKVLPECKPWASLVIAAFLFSTSPALSEGDASKDKTPDGRFGTHCYVFGMPSGDVEICSLSFYRLLARPEEYNKKNIVLTGMLVSYLGMPVFFPHPESYKSGTTADGILITGAIPEKFKKDLRKGLWPVVISGEFDAHCWGASIPFAGCITKVINIAKKTT